MFTPSQMSQNHDKTIQKHIISLNVWRFGHWECATSGVVRTSIVPPYDRPVNLQNDIHTSWGLCSRKCLQLSQLLGWHTRKELDAVATGLCSRKKLVEDVKASLLRQGMMESCSLYQGTTQQKEHVAVLLATSFSLLLVYNSHLFQKVSVCMSTNQSGCQPFWRAEL